MKTEKVMFVNARGFKEYAVRYKSGLFAKWQWVKDEKGNNKVMNFADSDAAIARLTADKIVAKLSKEA